VAPNNGIESVGQHSCSSAELLWAMVYIALNLTLGLCTNTNSSLISDGYAQGHTKSQLASGCGGTSLGSGVTQPILEGSQWILGLACPVDCARKIGALCVLNHHLTCFTAVTDHT
jgi:hypothetical protein